MIRVGEEIADTRAMPFSCDCHFHVFGSPERYPYSSDLRYAPPLAPLSEYCVLANRLGIERMVFIQPSAYGQDNSCLLDAMSELGAPCRGIVDVDERISEAELARMQAQGACGVRINVSPVKTPEAGFAAKLRPRIERWAVRCAEIGWQIDFLLPGWLTFELMGTLRKLPVDFTLAHMGMFLARDGVEQPGFQQLLDLLSHGEGRCWVKLTGAYRISLTPDFADTVPMARALIGAAADRILWGSDYPHLSFADRVSSIEQFNLLGRWAPDMATRKKILVDNPQQLFKF